LDWIGQRRASIKQEKTPMTEADEQKKGELVKIEERGTHSFHPSPVLSHSNCPFDRLGWFDVQEPEEKALPFLISTSLLLVDYLS
jgi:hypothetical protein